MENLKKFFNEIPPFTRYFVTSTFMLSLFMTYHLISPISLVLDYTKVFKNLQIWRLLTTFLFAGPFGPSFLFKMMMCYFTAKRVDEWFKTKHDEMLTLLLFCAAVIMAYSLVYGEYMVLHNSFLFSLMYVCCKLDPDSQVSIWGFPVTSANLPWVLLLLDVVQMGDIVSDLIGIAAGHTYIYVKTVLPNSHGYRVLNKLHPQAQRLINLFNHYFGSQPQRANVWGAGGTRVNVGGDDQ